MSEWISVKDRLPEHNKTVLAVTENKNQVVVIFLNDKHTTKFLNEYGINVPDDYRGHAFCSQERRGDCLNGVTHWMNLPEPPK